MFSLFKKWIKARTIPAKKEPPKEAIAEALKFPNAWVYEIDKAFKGKENVPPHGIVGAWKVDKNGVIEGDFIPNPNYRNPEDNSE